jgi:hypothetical protein
LPLNPSGEESSHVRVPFFLVHLFLCSIKVYFPLIIVPNISPANHEILVTGRNRNTSKASYLYIPCIVFLVMMTNLSLLQSSFLGRTSSGSSASSHRSVYRSYVFDCDDSNSSSRSCMSTSESNSEMVRFIDYSVDGFEHVLK